MAKLKKEMISSPEDFREKAHIKNVDEYEVGMVCSNIIQREIYEVLEGVGLL